MQENPVIVVGGGWAGISCAVELVKNQIPITLLEASPSLGGRARSVPFGDQIVDNGQHLFIGAYQNFRTLIKTLGLVESELFDIKPLSWHMIGTKKRMQLNFSKLPKPFHALFGFLTAKGLSFKEAQSIFKLMRKLAEVLQAKDTTVSAMLQKYKQPKDLIEFFWGPLCLAALTTPADKASAHLFARVLEDGLNQKASDSHMWFAKKDLSQVLPFPALDYLQQHQAQVHHHTRVLSLIIEQDTVVGVNTNKGQFHGHVVLATPYWATQTLLAPLPQCQKIHNQIKGLSSESITTIYIQYNHVVKLPNPMIGLNHTLSQWIFDRGFAKQPGLMAVVISGNGEHLEMPRDALFKQVDEELREEWPELGVARDWRIIHEKRGAFSAIPHIKLLRPEQVTPINQLYLAGDYTQTPYPSTLEGAVMSGKICAQEVLKRYQHDSITPTTLPLSA